MLSVASFEHAAGGEVDEVVFSTEAFECAAKLLFADGFKNRFNLAGRAMKGEITNRRIDRAGIAPEQAVGQCGVVREPALRFDESVGEL